MAYEFQLEDPGEGIHEAEILEIKVAKGDQVKEGDDVLVAETDKAAVDIPSPVSGTVREIKVSEGDLVNVGDVLVVFDQAGDEDADGSSDDEGKDERKEEAGEQAASGAAGERAESGSSGGQPEEDTGQEDTSDEEAAGTSESPGQQEGGGKAESSQDTGKKEKKAGRQGDGSLATPAVRGLARDLGVQLDTLEGSSNDGRILEEDVRAAAESDEGRTQKDDSQITETARETGEERVPLRSIRRATARRMAQSWSEIPHVVHQETIDITTLEYVRREHAESVERDGGKLTLTPFLVKTLASVLGDHPRFNAELDSEASEIVLHEAINIGVAVDTERGLLVPVVRDAASKSVVDIAIELKELSDRVRKEGAKGDMLKGATFSLTNVGAIGGTAFSPLISPPQVGILGTGRAELRQIVRGDLSMPEPETALILPVSLSFDHRVNDGADAARFVNDIARRLHDPTELIVRG